MAAYQKTVSIAGIRILVESEKPFEWSQRCEPFEVPNGEADVYMSLCEETECPDKVFSDENRVAELENGAIFQNGDTFTRVRYVGRNGDRLGWYLIWKKGDPFSFALHLAACTEERNSINPLSYVDLTTFLTDFRTLVLHSSVIDYRGRGIVFTAPSGTGKSTQADLWEKYRQSETINGDRSLIRKTESGYRVYGSPYAGSSHIYKNCAVPLTAIVVLRQAKRNRIRRLKPKEAYLCLLSELSVSGWDRDTVESQSNQILDLIENVPVYLLECLPDEGAVNTLYRELGEKIG